MYVKIKFIDHITCAAKLRVTKQTSHYWHPNPKLHKIHYHEITLSSSIYIMHSHHRAPNYWTRSWNSQRSEWGNCSRRRILRPSRRYRRDGIDVASGERRSSIPWFLFWRDGFNGTRTAYFHWERQNFEIKWRECIFLEIELQLKSSSLAYQSQCSSLASSAKDKNDNTNTMTSVFACCHLVHTKRTIAL